VSPVLAISAGLWKGRMNLVNQKKPDKRTLRIFFFTYEIK